MYTDPKDVNSPKASLGGPIEVLYDGKQGQFAVASFRWEGENAIGVRWNGTDTHPGMPQSRGLPTWFILPSPLEKSVLSALLPLHISATDGKYEKIQALIEKRKKDMGLRDRIITLQKSFLNQHQTQPVKVHISLKDELEIMTMDRNMIGNLVGNIFQDGPRALEKLFGMEIIWDAGSLALIGPNGERMDE